MSALQTHFRLLATAIHYRQATTRLFQNTVFHRVSTQPPKKAQYGKWMIHSTTPSSSEDSGGSAATQVETLPNPAELDIRVGKILSCEKHADADVLYVEQIDVGEESPRTICSGLVPYVPLEDMTDRSVLVLCNLKARTIRGVKSHGMVLCASKKDEERVEPLNLPKGAVVGERVRFAQGVDDVGEMMEPASENRVKKKKIWEQLQQVMKTDNEGVAMCDGQRMQLTNGVVTCNALPNSPIS